MVALEAVVEATSPRGVRRIAAEDFFTGLFQTALEPDEMVTAIEIPLWGRPFFFEEITRRLGDYAIVGLAASGTRLVFFSVGDRPMSRRATGALDLIRRTICRRRGRCGCIWRACSETGRCWRWGARHEDRADGEW